MCQPGLIYLALMARKPNRSTSERFTLYHLNETLAGQTLSAAIKSLLPKTSWGQVNNWIARRHIQVNGNLCLDPARRVSSTDVIKLWREPLAKPVAAEQLRLPYIDEHLLVVEKPAGITSVWHREERRLPARRRNLQPTLEELLSGAITKAIGPPRDLRAGNRFAAGGPAGQGRRKPGAPELRWPIFPVHRLDRDTSGLMIFARTRIAEQKLVVLFRDHRIDRQYWAVAVGHVSSQSVRSILIRDRGDGLRGSLTGSIVLSPLSQALVNAQPSEIEMAGIAKSDGQLAITHVELRETIGPYSLIRCRLETGRTHQIRIHLAELGHPLCGEKTYTRLPSGQTVAEPAAAPRQALHSERLAFTHPLTGERLEFKMPLPVDLKQWLGRLRNLVVEGQGNSQAQSQEHSDDN